MVISLKLVTQHPDQQYLLFRIINLSHHQPLPMNLRVAISLLLALAVVSGCVSKKKYLELDLRANKLENELKDRNLHIAQLEDELAQLRVDTARLGQELRASEKQYVDLLNESVDRTQLLNQELQAKTAELENKERLLLAFQGELEDREQKVKELNGIIQRQDSLSNALLAKVEAALVSFNEDELTVEMKGGKVYVSLSDQLLFQSGSANVNNKGREALLKVAEVLKKNPDIQVTIEGHTDNVPIRTAKFQDNWDLSVLRATEVVRILIWSGEVDPTRLKAAGRGQHQPVASNETRETRAQNRRTEIILEPDLSELYELLNAQ